MKSGLTGHWSFNQLDMNGLTALDRGGWGRNGTLANGPVATSSFMSGQAMSFASTSSNKISVPYEWSNFMSSTAGTISVWVKPTGNMPPSDTGGACSPGQGIVAGKGNMYLYLCRANMSGVDSLLAGVYDGGHERVSTSFTVGAWTHLVWVRDSSKLYLYKNGVLAGSVSAGGTVSLGDEMQIGQTSTDNGSLSFDGSIDDVRVYSRTLTSSEIKSLYRSTAGSKVNISQNTKVTSGLVGLWSFDGPDMAGVTAYDRSGQGNHGTLTSGPTLVIGKLGQALSFDGTSSYVAVSGTNGIPSGQSARTVSFWMYQNTRNDGGSAVIDILKSTGQSFTVTMTIIGSMYLFTDSVNVDNNITLTGSQIPSLKAWHHVVFTFDGGSNWVYYLDGVNAKSGTFSVTINTDSAGIHIGRRSSAASGFYDGKLDDVRIYNRALAPAEVKLLYNSGK